MRVDPLKDLLDFLARNCRIQHRAGIGVAGYRGFVRPLLREGPDPFRQGVMGVVRDLYLRGVVVLRNVTDAGVVIIGIVVEAAGDALDNGQCPL